MNRIPPQLWVWLTCLFVPALALGPSIAAGALWAAGDGLTQNMPHRVLAAAALWAGELPFWNAYVFGGMPFFATIQPGLFFPGNWPFLVLPAVAAQNVTAALPLAAAVGTLYLFVRATGLARLPSLFAGTVFALGGFLTMHIEHVQMDQIAALTPLLLWAIERFAQDGRRRHAAAAAVVVTGMVLAGSPQLTAYGLLVAAAYAVFRGLAVPVAQRPSFYLHGVVAGALGVGLSAAQLLPTLDFIASTQRAALGPDAFTFNSMPPEALLGFFAPYALGAHAPGFPVDQAFWGVPAWRGFVDGYVGVPALLLACLALGRFKVERSVRFWAGVAALSILLAMGSYTPLAWVVAHVPGLNAMRYADRHLFEFTLAAAVLAGHGLDWLLAPAPADAAARRRAFVVTSGALLGAGAGLWALIVALGPDVAMHLQPYMPAGIDMRHALSPLNPGLWLPLATVVLVAYAGARLIRTRDARAGLLLLGFSLADQLTYGRLQGLVLPQAPPEALRAPLPDRAAGRELTVSLLRYPLDPGRDHFQMLRAHRYPDVSFYAGLATVNGYDAFLPARYGRLLGMDSFGHAGEKAPDIWEPRHHALDVLGCRTVRLAPGVAQQPGWRERIASGRFTRLPDADGFTVLANPRALPLAWRVDRAVTLAPPEVDRRLSGLAPFDPTQEVLLDAPDAAVAPHGPGQVDAWWTGRNTLTVGTSGREGPALVVLSEGFDPGWTARLVEGPSSPRPLPILRANALMMALELPPERCVVEMTYRPRLWGTGLAVSALSFVLLLLWLGFSRLWPRLPIKPEAGT